MSPSKRHKGGHWERDVCRMLSLWVSGGSARDYFWRSASSGGRATRAAKRGEFLESQAGDIIAVRQEGMPLTGRFFVECKFLSDLQWGQTIFGTKSAKFFAAWKKARSQAETHNRYPMIVAKQNRYPPIMAIEVSIARLIGARPHSESRLVLPALGCVVYDLVSFLQSNWAHVERRIPCRRA